MKRYLTFDLPLHLFDPEFLLLGGGGFHNPGNWWGPLQNHQSPSTASFAPERSKQSQATSASATLKQGM